MRYTGHPKIMYTGLNTGMFKKGKLTHGESKFINNLKDLRQILQFWVTCIINSVFSIYFNSKVPIWSP